MSRRESQLGVWMTIYFDACSGKFYVTHVQTEHVDYMQRRYSFWMPLAMYICCARCVRLVRSTPSKGGAAQSYTIVGTNLYVRTPIP